MYSILFLRVLYFSGFSSEIGLRARQNTIHRHTETNYTHTVRMRQRNRDKETKRTSLNIMSHDWFGSHNETGEKFLIRETETSSESQTEKLEMPAPVWKG